MAIRARAPTRIDFAGGTTDLADYIASMSCTVDGNTTTLTAPYSLELSAGQVASCTLTNTQRGSITIVKQTLPDASTASFSFTGDVTGSISDGESLVVNDLAPGSYSVTESALNGWDLTGVVTIYAVSASGFGLVVALFGNLTRVAHVIASGDLDYYLALPANPLWHVLASRMNLSGWGDLLFGILLYHFHTAASQKTY